MKAGLVDAEEESDHCKRQRENGMAELNQRQVIFKLKLHFSSYSEYSGWQSYLFKIIL